MKRLLALATIICLLSSLAACGSKREETDPITPTADLHTPAPPQTIQNPEPQEPDEFSPTDTPDEESDSETPQAQEYELTSHFKSFSTDDGYSWEWQADLGQWVKASDSEAIEAAWRAVGGRGDAPTVKSFFNSANVTSPDNTIMFFGKVSLKDTTPGDFMLADTEKFLQGGLPYAYIPISLKVKADVRLYYSNSSVHAWTSSGPRDMSTVWVNPNLTGKTWGPVPFVVCMGGNVFAPSYPDGNPEVLDLFWHYGDEEFRIYPSWTDSNTEGDN